MRPSVYERRIRPTGLRVPGTNIGFPREPTLKDFYDVFYQLTNQRYYPDLTAKFVNVVIEKKANLVIEEEIITDINNLRGMSETKEGGSLIVKSLDSVIYFESKDKKCVGIESVRVDSFSFFLACMELINPLLLAQLEIYQKEPLMLLPSAILCYDGGRRFYNIFKANKGSAIQVEVGSPQDISSPMEFTLKELREVEHRIKDIYNTTYSSEEDLIKTEEEAPADYSSKDIETFRKFVGHIKKIKL